MPLQQDRRDSSCHPTCYIFSRIHTDRTTGTAYLMHVCKGASERQAYYVEQLPLTFYLFLTQNKCSSRRTPVYAINFSCCGPRIITGSRGPASMHGEGEMCMCKGLLQNTLTATSTRCRHSLAPLQRMRMALCLMRSNWGNVQTAGVAGVLLSYKTGDNTCNRRELGSTQDLL